MKDKMINCKQRHIIEPEFVHIQKFLLFHKYLYYEKDNPMLEDQGFDNAERYSFALAKNLGYRANKMKGPEENEKHHVHWMVGFNENNVYWEETKNKFNIR